MLRLTREVRINLPFTGEPDFIAHSHNTLAGNSPEAPGVYCSIEVSLQGEPVPQSQYIENIKAIDDEVRATPAAALLQLLHSGRWTLERATSLLGEKLASRWPNVLQGVRLKTNPYLWCDYLPKERAMTRLTQRFEFSAAHRLHNDALDERKNRELFGKCNNPAGHGHNYELDVTLAGEPDSNGHLIAQDQFQGIVQRLVLERFDHKHLNLQTEEFRDAIPSVENIARAIYTLLEKEFAGKLHSVRVWESGKTSAEYRR